MVYASLLIIHIAAGTAALAGAAGAVATKVFNFNHRLHLISGRVFFYGMLFVFLTTVPMTMIRPNMFLLLIGVFSFYMAYSGWRKAVNRQGIAGPQDLLAILVMGATAMGMIGWGGYLTLSGEGNGVTLIVFGSIGAILAVNDIKNYTTGPLQGKERINAHLTNMMGATIAAVTAVLVVNIQTDPAWIAWIAPTIVLTPVIFWMVRK